MLATHPNPHLDDICGIWLLKRFHPDYVDAQVTFIPQGVSFDEQTVGVGIGRGKYDEHKGDIHESAATLVWNDIKNKVKNESTKKALDIIAQWVKDEDQAKFMGTPQHEFSIAVTAMSLAKTQNMDSQDVLTWGMQALDGLLITMLEHVQLQHDWQQKKTLETPWGKAVALKTSAGSAAIGQKSMEEGYVMFIVENPENGYKFIKSAVREAHVDLTQAYKRVIEREPDAEWYLHHSKRMLICGSSVAQNNNLSKLTLNELTQLVI